MADELNGKKLDELTEAVEGVATTVDEIKTILVGNTKNPDKKGLLERVRSIEKWIETRIEKRERLEKLVVAAVIGNFVGLIFIVIRYALLPK